MVENVNMELLSSEKAQERIKELVEQSEKGYVDALHNVVFKKLQIEDLKKDFKEDSTEEEKKSFDSTVDNNEKALRANEWWMKQYEVAIPYFKSLLK